MSQEIQGAQPAHAGLFDDSVPLYQRLAEFIYSLGWRPDCDAQHHNLRDNLHVFVEVLNPIAYRKLRDEFAGKAMQGLIVDPERADQSREECARLAYLMADAMLKARTA